MMKSHPIFSTSAAQGLDLIDKIAKQEADDDGMPLKDPIKMKTIRIEEFEG